MQLIYSYYKSKSSRNSKLQVISKSGSSGDNFLIQQRLKTASVTSKGE